MYVISVICNKVSHDRTMGEWVYLIVCPLRGQGNDCSVGEWIYLTVCPLHGPGHDSSVREWMYLTVSPLRGPGFNSRPWWGISRNFPPGWSHTLGEEMGASKSSQAHWKNTRNTKLLLPPGSNPHIRQGHGSKNISSVCLQLCLVVLTTTHSLNVISPSPNRPPLFGMSLWSEVLALFRYQLLKLIQPKC